MPQDDGTKSRVRLVTTITKRSSHIPTFTTSAITKTAGMLMRTRRDHSNCGIMILHRIKTQ